MGSREVADLLQSRIVRGDYQPGDHLNLARLAARLRVRQHIVRDALYILITRGVARHAGTGSCRRVVVAPREKIDRWKTTELLARCRAGAR